MSVYSFVPVLLTALIGFLVYRYRNRIGYTVITIGGDIPDDCNEIKLKGGWGRVKAERLKLKNYGLRNLENVELHLTMPSKPITIDVKEPSSLSKRSVKTDWQDKILTISLDSFPSKEEVEVDMIRLGHYEPIDGRLKGTGGKYKIVRIERHEIKRQIFDYLILAILLIVPPMIGSWLDSRAASRQTVPKQVAPPDEGQLQPVTPANTKG